MFLLRSHIVNYKFHEFNMLWRSQWIVKNLSKNFTISGWAHISKMIDFFKKNYLLY